MFVRVKNECEERLNYSNRLIRVTRTNSTYRLNNTRQL